MEEKRITEFGEQEVKLVNGVVAKVRPLTFKEKKAYLDLVKGISDTQPDDIASAYIEMQITVSLYILNILNPDVTREVVEAGLNGEIFKKLMDVAFYDPFSVGMLGK